MLYSPTPMPKTNRISFGQRLWRAINIYRYAVLDKRTPWGMKLLSGFILLYILSPIDIVPDVLPVIGQMDDLVVFIAGVLRAYQMIPPHLREEFERRVTGTWDSAFAPKDRDFPKP